MSTKEFTQQIFALTDNMGDMQPLPTSLFSAFAPAELASAATLAASLSSPLASGATNMKVAALDAAFCLTGGAHADFQSLLDGFMSATDIRARGDFLSHAARWINGNAPQIERALSYMRRFSALQEMPIVPVPIQGLSASGTAYAGAGLGLPSASRSAHRAAGRAKAGGVALATGAMSQELRKVLHLSQSLELKQAQALIQRLSEGDFYSGLYRDARKLEVDIPELGLNFETALVSRFDLPEMIHLGTSGLMAYGLAFVMEDFFADVTGVEKDTFIKLCAVHEYGEVILGDHHKASLLELAVAKHWEILERYLEFLDGRYSAKFRDVAMHRLKGRLVKGLAEAGFEIEPPPDDEIEWTPPEKEDPEVIKLLGIIGQNPVPESIAARFAAAVRDDMKMSKDELDGWITYVTALEQTRACHARASSDAEEILSPSSSALDLRIALFRALGVLQSEMEDEVMDSNVLGDDLRDHLFSKFIETLRGIIEDRAPQLASDPLLSATRSHFERLAAADAAIWRALGLNLRLAGLEEDDDKSEQEKIKETRMAAWRHAVEASSEIERQIAILGEYADALKIFEDNIRYRLDDVLEAFKSAYDDSGSPIGYFDLDDYRAALKARLWDQIRRICPVAENTFIGELIDARVAGVLPDIGFQFARAPVHHSLSGLSIESIARLEYLSGIYPARGWAARERIKRNIIPILRTAELAAAAGDTGLIPKSLAITLARDTLNAGFISRYLELEPPIERLPYQIVLEGGNLDRVLERYRKMFRVQLEVATGGSRTLTIALKRAARFWDRLKDRFTGHAAPIFKLAEEYPAILPHLACAFSGLTPETLWERLDIAPACDRKPRKFKERSNLYAPVAGGEREFLSIARYLTPYAVTDEDSVKFSADAMERVALFGRWQVMQAISGNPVLVLNPEYTRVRLDLHAEWMRRGLMAHLARTSGRPVHEISAALPDFRMDADELWNLQAHLNAEFPENSFELKTGFVDFLADIFHYSIEPSDELAAKIASGRRGVMPPAGALPWPEARQAIEGINEFIRNLDDKEGYDRLGTIGTRRKRMYLQILDDSEAKPSEIKDAWRRIHEHYCAILGCLASAGRLSKECTGDELATLAHEIYEAAGCYNITTVEMFDPIYTAAMTASQFYLLLEMELGAKLTGDKDVLEYLKGKLDWIHDTLAEHEFEKEFLHEYSLVSPSPLAGIRCAYTLEAIEDGAYDALGSISREERLDVTGRIMERDRAKKRIEKNALEALGGHWKDVIAALAGHPDIERARRILLDVTRDAMAVHERLSRDSFSHTLAGTTDVVWMARQAWALMEIKSGRSFVHGNEVLAAIPEDMLFPGEKRVQDPIRGFHKYLIMTASVCEERLNLAKKLRAHFGTHRQR